MYRQTFDDPRPVDLPDSLPAPEPVAPPRRGVIATFAARLSARAVRQARRRRFIRDFRKLDSLPDHMLRDIGIHRGDINEVRLRALLNDPANWDV